jgi:glycosyltransferase involved in cell wall biosynthesis
VNRADVSRSLYRAVVSAATCASLAVRAPEGRLAVNYGGARRGDFGGPRVKISLLSERFPERHVGFSLLYLLSNSIYLSQRVIKAVERAAVPIVLNQNGVFYRAWYPQNWQRENARIAAVHARANYVLYQSEFCRQCAQRFLGPRTGQAEILYNAVDTKRFSPRVGGRTGRGFGFLVTGKIGPSTAYRLTASIEGLAAARRCGVEADLVIAGLIDPSVEASARQLAERLGVARCVEFTGLYRAAQAPAIYQAADAYLMMKQNDPCPNVVLEALACGLPVLYSASGGVPELVGTQAGIGLSVSDGFDHVAVPSPTAIAEGMARIVQHHEEMSHAARARALAHFDITPWLDRHAVVFARLLGMHR